MIVANARRGARALVYAWRSAGSRLRLIRYRCLYAGFHPGKNVRIGRGVYINVITGASLVLGDDVVIDDHCHLTAAGDISIGPRGFIGAGSVIVAAACVTIGDDALIAAYVTIRDQDHRFDCPGRPFRSQGLVSAPVSIGRNVWLGTKATILKGVTIGDDTIVGANAVVTRSIAGGSIAAGAPARVLRRLGAATRLEESSVD